MDEIVINSQYASIVKTRRTSEKITNKADETNFNPYTRTSMISTPVLFRRLGELSGAEPEILPANCRYIKRIGAKSRIYVIEEAPQIRTVTLDYNLDNQIQRLKKQGKWKDLGYKQEHYPFTFQLMFPYIVYLIYIDTNGHCGGTKIFFRKHPIHGMCDELYRANLSNISSGQSICLGSNMRSNSDRKTYADEIEHTLERFWMNHFNSDYLNNPVRYFDNEVPYVGTFFEWNYYSINDPMFIFEAPWMKYQSTLGKEIHNYFSNSNNNPVSYGGIVNAFTGVTSAEPVENIKESQDGLFNNVTNSLYMEDTALEIGDKVVWNSEDVYVVDFVGDRDHNVKFIDSENEKGEMRRIPVTDSLRRQFNTQLKKNNQLAFTVTAGGQKLKIGDVIEWWRPGSSSKKLSKVEKIRQLRNNIVEAKIGGRYYFLPNIEFEKFDLSSVTLNGEVLENDKLYYYSSHDPGRLRRATFIIRESKFENIEIVRGTIKATFRDTQGTTFALNGTGSEIVSNQIVPAPNFDEDNSMAVYRSICGLITPTEGNPHFLLRGVGTIKKGSDDGMGHPPYVPETAVNVTVTSERVFIPGFDVDIDYKIGDMVVVSDWSNPQEMLKPRIITGFMLTGENDVLIVKSQCVDQKTERIDTLVNYRMNRVYAGVIQHITFEHEGVTAGTKIRSKLSGVPKFPKKDVVMIVGFLPDSNVENPLVLMSNYCTVHFSDLIDEAQFTVYKVGSKQWEKWAPATPNHTNIRHQMGDMYTYEHTVYMLAGTRDSSSRIYAINMVNNGRMEAWRQSNEVQSYLTRHGFLSPRRPQADEVDKVRKGVIPDCHGGFTEFPDSFITLPETYITK